MLRFSLPIRQKNHNLMASEGFYKNNVGDYNTQRSSLESEESLFQREDTKKNAACELR